MGGIQSDPELTMSANELSEQTTPLIISLTSAVFLVAMTAIQETAEARRVQGGCGRAANLVCEGVSM